MVDFRDASIDIDASFCRHPISDDLKVKKNEAAVIQHIDLLLNMGTYATLFRPFVCADLRQFLFEELTPHNRTRILNRINSSLLHERRALATEVITGNSQDGNEINIRIDFRFLNTDKEFTYSTTLKRVI